MEEHVCCTITGIEKRGRSGDYTVYIDGEPGFEADEETLFALGLRVGVKLDGRAVKQVMETAEGRRARAYALRLLTIRTRTENEIRRRLLDRNFTSVCAEQTVEWLKALGYLDDRAYARDWIETRARSKPSGRRLIVWELQQKGVDQDVVNEVLAEIDPDEELELARAAAQERLRRMADSNRERVRRRLVAHLYRRGFRQETAGKVVSELLNKVFDKEAEH